MSRLEFVVVGLLLLAVFSGCASPGRTPQDVGDAPRPTVGTAPSPGATVPAANRTLLPPNETLYFEGVYDAMVLHTVGTISDHRDFSQWRPIQKMGATLSWTSPGDAEDLDVALVAPGGNGEYYRAQFVDVDGWFVNRAGVHGLPDNPASVTLERDDLAAFDGCDPCEWSVWALAKGGSVDVAYKVRVDIEYMDASAAG